MFRIKNEGRIDFSYRLSEKTPIITNTVFSNVAQTDIISDSLKIKKYADKDVCSIFDIITYIIEIENISSINITNLFFKDSIPYGTKLIKNSVHIDGVSKRCLDPTKGFNILRINANSKIIIHFKAIVVSTQNGNFITNISTVNYDYIYNTDLPPVKIPIESNPNVTFLEDNLFKCVTIQNKLTLPKNYPKILCVNKISYNLEYINYKLLPSRTNSLCKVLLIGKITYCIHYSYRCNNSNRSACYKECFGFSTFINAPYGLTYSKINEIIAKFHDNSFKILNRKCIFISSSLLLKLC